MSCARTRPRRSPGSASSTPPSSAAAWPSTWVSARPRPCSPISPARRQGTALVIAPAAVVGNWAAEAARFVPELRVVVHHGASRSAAASSRPRSPRPTSSSPPTPRRSATSMRWPRSVGTDRARRGAGDQEPGERDRPAAAPHPGPDPPRAHRHADRERARRPVGDPRLHQPRPRRLPAGVHRPDVGRRRDRPAGAERDPAVPPHEDRAGGRGRAPRQDRRARPLHDDRRADRPLPSRARRARRRTSPTRRPRRAKKGAILAAITALKQICNHPAAYRDDGRAARRPLRQAGPPRGDRRVGLRRRRADPRVHPLRRRGAAAWPSTSARSPARRSPATTAASREAPATDWSPSSSTARAPARWCCR